MVDVQQAGELRFVAGLQAGQNGPVLVEGGGEDILGVLEVQDVEAGGLPVRTLDELPGPAWPPRAKSS